MAKEVRGVANGAQVASSDSDKSFLTQAPSITLPKGGGAIQGIGEKFGANPVNGTASMTVPIFASPGRSGFGPQLTLSYDSGAGNGPFGLGWSLGIPSITRGTAKGIPQYRDHEESDVFVLAGAEDLVPFLKPGTAGAWVRDSATRTANGVRYRIDRYRPRVEGTFALIERWTQTATRETHWRTITRDNVTTIFGADATSRIADPADPTRVFSWLVARTLDDKGNVAVYTYLSDDFAGVDITAFHERNRNHVAPGTQRYPERILYGNVSPYVPDLSVVPATPLPAAWLFELVFDYGDHDGAGPTPTATSTWRARPDPSSAYRAGFEVRTHRLCERVLMFHRFTELGTEPCLVRSTDFTYQRGGDRTDPTALPFSFLSSVRQNAYKRDAAQPGGYRSAATPPVEFSYSRAAIAREIELLDPSALENLPVGLTGAGYQWVDLNGEGLSGVLTEQAGAWYYKPNLGGGQFDRTTVVTPQPSMAALASGRQQLMDLAGDGQLDLVDLSGAVPGLQERTDDEGWSPFAPFASLPRIDWSDANLRFIDLTGDGLADALVTEHDVFTWYPSLGEEGFAAANRTRTALDERQGPRVVFADGTQTVFIADMSGDGLADIVRIRNGEVCYWPNLGYGNFGAQVTLDHAPWFDHPEAYDPRRIRLADVDGSGPTDIIYLGADGARLYVNRSGNALSDPRTLPFPIATDNLAAVQVADLFGNGTACLIWSTGLPADARNPVRYLDLMGGKKPHLLTGVKNNLGAETTVDYAPSTKFYLRDKQAGVPWITRLPFPVHCVEKVTVTDKWRKATFSSTYSYHHGFFDSEEREFRGFARVEQLDVESFGTFAAANIASPYVSTNRTLYQPPIKTITWFHTGALPHRSGVSLLAEYFPRSLAAERAVVPLAPGFAENPPALPAMPDGLDGDEWREAARACKGIALRQEVYELDVDALDPPAGTPPQETAVRLFSAATHNCQVRRLQPRSKTRHGVFLVTERDALTYQYELDLRDLTLAPPGAAIEPLKPDPRVTHTLNLSFDEYGQAQQTVAVGYSRWRLFADPDAVTQTLVRDVQGERHAAYTETRYTSDAIDPATGAVPIEFYRLRVPCEVETYELTAIALPAGRVYFAAGDFLAFDLSDRYRVPGTLQPIARKKYHERPPSTAAMRLVEHTRSRFFADDPANTARFLREPLELGTLGRLGLIYEQYKLALTKSLLDAVFTPAQLAQPTRPGATVASDLRGQARAGYVSGALFYPVPPPATMPADAPDEYWIRSGVAGFDAGTAQHFYLPRRYTDPFDNVSVVTYDARDLFVASATDAAQNTTRVTRFDYRVLAPVELEDINANLTEAYFDVLGRVVAVAVKGKGTEADDLVGFTDDVANPSATDLDALFRAAPDRATARRLLGHATARFVTHFGDVAGVWAARPAGACRIVREEHVADVVRRQQADPNAESKFQMAFECSDGLGTVLMTRSQAEPATAGAAPRWIVSGKTVLNNKGKPVKQYEPYFSQTAVCRGEGALQEEVGVTPLLYYDAAGRLVRTELPDGSLSRVLFSPWHVATYDANDTVKESTWYTSRNPLPPQAAIPRDPMTGNLLCTPEQRAAWLSAHHADTPSTSILDSLGRAVVAMRHNRVADAAGTITLGGTSYRDERDITYTKLDAEGKALWIRDARRNLVMQYITPTKATRWADESNEAVPSNSVPAYDVAGNLLFQHSMDAGDRWMINDAAGKPLFAWNARGQLIISSYDGLRRPTTVELVSAAHTSPIMVALTQYAGRTAADIQNNRCGTAWRMFDQSGVVTSVEFDFKGNARRATRRLANDYDADTDWRGVVALALTAEPDAQLMAETFTRIASYDALSRMTLLYNWHRSGQPVSVYALEYGDRGLLDKETLTVGATKTAAGHSGGAATTVIMSQTHDAKGQRLRLALGNGVVTSYDYDAESFRLVRLRSRRSNNDVLQDLQYTYDAAGNIVELTDDAKPTEFFDNAVIEPRRRYEYDALYRLIEASGREHAGQANIAANDNWNDCPFRVDYGATNVKAWRNYTQRFEYDVVGNILEMRHQVANNAARSWTRQYEYAIDSNRLLATETGAPPIATHYPAGAATLANTYQYNAHGSLTSLAHLPQMDWNFTEHLSHVSRSAALTGTDPDGCPDSSLEAWYRYGVTKQRSRKRVAKQGGIVEERLYLDGLEWYRRTVNGTLSDEVETLHVLDGQKRVLMVDQVRAPGRPGTTLYRYTLGDHLDSSTVEVNENADAISFEEYHPYGTTAYQSGPNAGEVKRKRYRYTGMERDEESGFSYHTARYYSPALCRWTSCDPSGLKDGVNVFTYVNGNPLSARDPGGRQQQPATKEQELPKTADEMLALADEVYHSGKAGSIARSQELSRLGHQMAMKEAMDIAHKTRDEGAKMSNTVMAVLLAPLAVGMIAAAVVETTAVASVIAVARALLAAARGIWLVWRFYIGGMSIGIKQTYEALVRNGVSVQSVVSAINTAGANPQVRGTLEMGAQVVIDGGPIDPVHGSVVSAPVAAVKEEVKEEVKALVAAAPAATKKVATTTSEVFGVLTQMRDEEVAMVKQLYPEFMLAGKPTPDIRGASWATWFGNVLNERMRWRVLGAQAEGTLTQSLMMTRQGQKGIDFWLPNGIGFDLFPATEAGMISHMKKFENALAPDGKTTVTEMMALLYFRDK